MKGMKLGKFSDRANRFVESLPPRLLETLNGGIIIEPKAKREGDYLIMGEYLEDPGLGKLIILYFGSFWDSLGSAPEDKWDEEIQETILHELRHHVESLAGIDDLSVEEILELQHEDSDEDG
jgi:hypothetical protein